MMFPKHTTYISPLKVKVYLPFLPVGQIKVVSLRILLGQKRYQPTTIAPGQVSVFAFLCSRDAESFGEKKWLTLKCTFFATPVLQLLDHMVELQSKSILYPSCSTVMEFSQHWFTLTMYWLSCIPYAPGISCAGHAQLTINHIDRDCCFLCTHRNIYQCHLLGLWRFKNGWIKLQFPGGNARV